MAEKIIKMTDKYNIETLNSYVKSNKNGEDICRWFDRMASDYHKLRKDGKVTDELKIELLDFWTSINMEYGDSIFQMLNYHWMDRKIDMIQDFSAFAPKYHEICYERAAKRLDETELAETEALFNEIWNKGYRAELSFNFYDYDEDKFQDLTYTLPRRDREDVKFELKELCAKNIFNRGSVFMKFYGPRGTAEYAAISVDENGCWSCLTEPEIAGIYSNEDEEPFTTRKNEKVIMFDHGPKKGLADMKNGKTIMFNPKYS